MHEKQRNLMTIYLYESVTSYSYSTFIKLHQTFSHCRNLQQCWRSLVHIGIYFFAVTHLGIEPVHFLVVLSPAWQTMYLLDADYQLLSTQLRFSALTFCICCVPHATQTHVRLSLGYLETGTCYFQTHPHYLSYSS